MSRRYLTLPVVEACVPAMQERGVSAVARSARGFLGQYRKAGGDPERLDPWWRRRRDNFLSRHVAQAKKNGEPWWRDGEPTRRHLALIAWAWTPTPLNLAEWLSR